ncbi:hypothetical protein Tco_1178320, partial [Tanacetum coccineum]
MKAELRSLKLGDLSINAYFRKIESIDTILTSLGSPVSNDDAVTIIFKGLPDKYDNVFGIIVHQEPFSDLKMDRSMLTAEEMRLKLRAQASPIDSTFSSPLVLLANGGLYPFGEHFKFLHNGVHGNTLLWSTSNVHPTPPSTTTPTMTHDRMALIQTQQALLAKLGYNDKNNIGRLLANTPVLNPTRNTTHVALHMSPSHTSHGSAQSYATYHSPPGFSFLQEAAHQPSPQSGQPGQATNMGQSGQLAGIETILPNAFNAMTLHDPTNGNWNMDTCASSYLNDSVYSLSDVFNLCIYPSVSFGDGYSIPVTNFDHSILPTPHRPLHLNNIIITPNIVKNLIFACQFFRDNHCTIEFDAFGFSVKDFMTRRALLRCDITRDLYTVTKPSTIPYAFLTSQYAWHQRLGHP